MAANALREMRRAETVLRFPGKELLHQPVFEGMVGDDDHPAARFQYAAQAFQGGLENVQFVVNKNSKSLEDPGQRSASQGASGYTPHGFRQCAGGSEPAGRGLVVDSGGNGAGLALLPITGQDIDQGRGRQV